MAYGISTDRKVLNDIVLLLVVAIPMGRMSFLKFSLVAFIALVPLATQAWNGKIVFRDEFEATSLNLAKWEYETGSEGYGDDNLEYYVGGKANVQLQDGKLVLTAKVQKREGKNYTSGRIRQKGPGFAYGAYVARAKLPKGKHLWPAFWLLKETSCKYEEIDIMEYRGQEPSDVEWTAHYGRTYNRIESKSDHKTLPFDLSEDFHEYAVLWQPKTMGFYVDNVKYVELSLSPPEWRKGNNNPCGNKTIPFAEKSNFILNLGVGGGFFKEYPQLTLEEARQWPKNTYEIDWVRIYQDG